jgi:hypothetical protein
VRNDLATIARIRTAENILALASDLVESVMFMAERGPGAADEQELLRILTVATKLKHIAKELRSNHETHTR